MDNAAPNVPHIPRPHAVDEAAAKRLWDVSVEATGLDAF
jgi:hypothetical protein